MKVAKILITVYLLAFARMATAQCSINMMPTAFGLYLPFDTAPTDSSGAIAVNCDPAILYNVKLDAGIYSLGSFYPRKMSNPLNGATLVYNLYRDATHSQVWGDGIGGTYYYSGVGVGSTEYLTVYGSIPQGQNIPSGSYSDVISVLVEW